ncbi:MULTISPECIES: thiol:disulfide interchange protein DsbA/DsbL [Oleiagrimonas]|uniref:Thiol:disulfide interchange protein n=1 Tax=Oleiagrimonas citrea TaxID=1665687 RepID=A0A846ZL22_9GAMM|nr:MULTISPECIES: thiol:disulfide interchange protein DsbA/DsbL [Oleiagrimonas]NKZ38502.1 thiol:disulfide interchange protein DsbA/DsbL [Oleiagrimonas citrea]RAP58248.1 disulfide bond formation protein DsbA [Oleiagrimonas sp. MCCC 1A03011]
MIKRIALLVLGITLASACSAKDDGSVQAASFTNGNEYVTIQQPKRLSSSGKVEVVEVFSYGCVHCAHFAPDAEKLRKSLPKGVQFKLLPASFSPAWEPYARAYYAAKQLGVLKQTHLELFKEKFEERYPINTLDELADFYARQGVDKAKFLQAANSKQTDMAIARGNALIRDWGVDGTPTIVVDGKYRSNHIKSYDQLLKLTHWLVQRELKKGS